MRLQVAVLQHVPHDGEGEAVREDRQLDVAVAEGVLELGLALGQRPVPVAGVSDLKTYSSKKEGEKLEKNKFEQKVR